MSSEAINDVKVGNCLHEELEASVNAIKLTSDDEIDRWVMEARIRCGSCHESFGFLVPDQGLLDDRPTASLDFKELRVPLIAPLDITFVKVGEDE